MGGRVSLIDGHIDEVLKPCPCCGGKAGYTTERYYATTYVAVQCNFCGLQTIDFVGETAWEDAADAWNRRVNDD